MLGPICGPWTPCRSDKLLNLRNAGGTAHQHHIVHLALGQLAVLEHLLDGVQACAEEVLAELLETFRTSAVCAQPAGPTRAKAGLETHLNMPVDQIFDEIDKDENGTINHSELLQYLLGKGQEPETVSELFAILDTNDDGQISREELATGTQARARHDAPTARRRRHMALLQLEYSRPRTPRPGC